MKILALACVISTIIICPNSEARSMQTQRQEILRNVEVNGEKQARLVGLLNIDFPKKTISLSIVNDICGQYADLPAGTIRCMAMAMPVEIINVPLSSVKNDGCGSFVYQGRQNDMPLDGSLKEITFVDNSSRTCESMNENVIESILVLDAKVTSPRPRSETVYHITK